MSASQDWELVRAEAGMLKNVLGLSYPDLAELLDIKDPRTIRYWFDGLRYPKSPTGVIKTLRDLDDAVTEMVGIVLDDPEEFCVDMDSNDPPEWVVLHRPLDEDAYLASPEYISHGLPYRRYMTFLDRLHIAFRHEGYNVFWKYRNDRGAS